MKPYATIRGSIVDATGKPTSAYGILIKGAVPPNKYLGNYVRKSKLVPKGTFAITVAPDEVYSGRFMRKTYNTWYPRPLLGSAFGPVTPKPGEELGLGNLQVSTATDEQ